MWGELDEMITGRRLALGSTFFPPKEEDPETALWRELAATGGFSNQTLLETRIPLSYATTPRWTGPCSSPKIALS